MITILDLFKKFSLAERKESIKEGYRLSQGHFMRLGGLYPNLMGGIHNLTIVHSVVIFTLMSFFVFSFLKTATLTHNRFVFNEVIHFSVIIMLPISCTLNTILRRKDINAIFHIVGNHFYTYQDSFVDLTPQYNKQRVFVKYFLVFWGLMVGGTVFLNDICYFLSDVFKDNYDKIVDGVQYNMLIPKWSPVRISVYMGIPMEVCGQAFFVFGITAIDAPFVAICNELYMQLKLLKLSIATISQRTLAKFARIKEQKHYLGHVKLLEENFLTDCFVDCLRENAKHHEIIIKCFNHLQTWIGFQLMAVFSAGALLICFSALTITERNVDLSLLISTVVILLAELIHVFLYCVLGELIIDSSEDVRDELYFTSWYSFKPRVKNTMLIMQMRLYHPLKLNFAGLLWASLNSFSQVLSSSYSYFNLVRATREQ